MKVIIQTIENGMPVRTEYIIQSRADAVALARELRGVIIRYV